jgi:hypothetical protein
MFDRLEKQEIIFVVSDLLDLELTFAPEKVKQYYIDIRPRILRELT